MAAEGIAAPIDPAPTATVLADNLYEPMSAVEICRR